MWHLSVSWENIMRETRKNKETRDERLAEAKCGCEVIHWEVFNETLKIMNSTYSIIFNKWTIIGTEEYPTNKNTCHHRVYILVWGKKQSRNKIDFPWMTSSSSVVLVTIYILTPKFTYLALMSLWNLRLIYPMANSMSPLQLNMIKIKLLIFSPKSVSPTAYPILINGLTTPLIVQAKNPWFFSFLHHSASDLSANLLGSTIKIHNESDHSSLPPWLSPQFTISCYHLSPE